MAQTPTVTTPEKHTKMTNGNQVIECLCTRRSVRCYKNLQITNDELDAVLGAGMYAPTAHGRQDPWIVAVQTPSVIERLVAMNARVMGTSENPYYGAPTIVLVFGSDTETWPNSVCDGTLVLGNMMNAAHAMGLASCWINREREMFATDEGRAMMREFGLPDGLIGIGAIALGYAEGEARPAKPRKQGYVRIV